METHSQNYIPGYELSLERHVSHPCFAYKGQVKFAGTQSTQETLSDDISQLQRKIEKGPTIQTSIRYNNNEEHF